MLQQAGPYLIFFIIPMILGFAVQGSLTRTVKRWSAVSDSSGMTGAQVARRILDMNGLSNVPVEQAPGGALSDHYDPKSRTVRLSEDVYDQRTVTATAIAAHEVGHAIQHAQSYVPMSLRSALFPAVSFASQFWILLLMGGLFLQISGLYLAAIVLYAIVVLFQLVTLPVEFDASRRGAAQLAGLGIVNDEERVGVRKVLTAAAMTYVAGALAAIAQLLYFLSLYNRN